MFIVFIYKGFFNLYEICVICLICVKSCLGFEGCVIPASSCFEEKFIGFLFVLIHILN